MLYAILSYAIFLYLTEENVGEYLCDLRAEKNFLKLQKHKSQGKQ